MLLNKIGVVELLLPLLLLLLPPPPLLLPPRLPQPDPLQLQLLPKLFLLLFQLSLQGSDPLAFVRRNGNDDVLLLTSRRGRGGGRRVELIQRLSELSEELLFPSFDGIEGEGWRRLVVRGLVVVARGRRRRKEGGLKMVELGEARVERWLLREPWLLDKVGRSRGLMLVMMRMKVGMRREGGRFVGREVEERHA
ncbi:hypothetical protein BDY24DRAFT_375546 [Mrakia frigida]|uniref:uncharacterized protein n=1 Tax=Mrakia frigida TaxID=29902 RepID=UPI003FCC0109